jgi:hypothetical protein
VTAEVECGSRRELAVCPTKTEPEVKAYGC